MPYPGIIELNIQAIDENDPHDPCAEFSYGEYDEFQLRAEMNAMKQRQAARHNTAKHRDRRFDR